ncbi:MAG: class I SAM-dependent methyltransferase [Rubrivivax sp.]|nr:class I SAM-dependent methyltransferase [Rubrivivax sp.]
MPGPPAAPPAAPAPAAGSTAAFARHETDAVRERYARRAAAVAADRYSLLASPAALREQQQRLRAMAALWRAHGWATLHDKALCEVGCGAGGNLADLLRLGAAPARLSGLELLPERAAAARAALPAAVRVVEGDALQADMTPGSQQAVLAFTVFSSLLDDAFQQRLAAAMWRWTAPGGGVLVYDFTVDNPRNRDVRGVPLARWRALFPQGRVQARRLTLAPPIARALEHRAPALLPLLEALPPLRTHLLAWITKPT